MRTLSTLRSRYLRKLILDKDYNSVRADAMNDRIHYWRESQRSSNIRTIKQVCDLMILMYLRRYTFYISGGLQNIKPLSQEEVERIKNNLNN